MESKFQDKFVSEIAFCVSESSSVILINFMKLKEKKSFGLKNLSMNPSIEIPDLSIHKPNFVILVVEKIDLVRKILFFQQGA